MNSECGQVMSLGSGMTPQRASTIGDGAGMKTDSAPRAGNRSQAPGNRIGVLGNDSGNFLGSAPGDWERSRGGGDGSGIAGDESGGVGSGPEAVGMESGVGNSECTKFSD